jgi:hypothetical protein
MKSNKKTKKEYITHKELERLLAEQSKIIVGAVDVLLNKRTVEIKAEVKEVRKDLRMTEKRLEKKIDNVQTLIDGYVKAQEEFKQDFVIMKEEVRIMKNIIKEKLGVEVKII